MQKTVADLMSLNFVTVSAEWSLADALEVLVESEATELCIVDDDGRLEGIVTDYELLKASLIGDLHERTVAAYLSRAVTMVPATALISQIVPLFRDGVCSRAFVCEARKLVGRLSRTAVLRSMCSVSRSEVTPLCLVTAEGRTATIQPRVELPRAPQFLGTSVLGSVGT